jgi:hypothetical protein
MATILLTRRQAGGLPPPTVREDQRTKGRTNVATWSDVINDVRTKYEVMEEKVDWLRFRLGTGEQQVTVHHLPNAGGSAWVEISSPVGRADEIDPRRLLELAGTSVAGGAAVVGGVALLKHTVPLADLSVREEFEHPLRLVVADAVAFAHELTRAGRPRRPAHTGEVGSSLRPAEDHTPALAGVTRV